jgi:hypothetical protein
MTRMVQFSVILNFKLNLKSRSSAYLVVVRPAGRPGSASEIILMIMPVIYESHWHRPVWSRCQWASSVRTSG